MLPGLSAAHAKGDAERYNALLDHGLRLVLLVGVPASIGLLVDGGRVGRLPLPGPQLHGGGRLPDGLGRHGLRGGVDRPHCAENHRARLLRPQGHPHAGARGLRVLGRRAVGEPRLRAALRARGVGALGRDRKLRERLDAPHAPHAPRDLQALDRLGRLRASHRRRDRTSWPRASGSRSGVVWTDLVWTWRAAGALGIVAGAAVIYFGVLFVTGWRLSDLRPKR